MWIREECNLIVRDTNYNKDYIGRILKLFRLLICYRLRIHVTCAAMKLNWIDFVYISLYLYMLYIEVYWLNIHEWNIILISYISIGINQKGKNNIYLIFIEKTFKEDWTIMMPSIINISHVKWKSKTSNVCLSFHCIW